MARSRAVDAREPGQIREEAALSEAAHAPRVSLAGAEPGGTLEASVSKRGARSTFFSMRLALATCDWLPELDPDDAPLREALGEEAEPAVWSDPDVDWSAYDVVLVRTIWDYFERHDEFLAWLDRVPVPDVEPGRHAPLEQREDATCASSRRRASARSRRRGRARCHGTTRSSSRPSPAARSACGAPRRASRSSPASWRSRSSPTS